MNALKNEKIQHEIGETESTIHVGETSQDIKKLSEDYEATKIKLKDEGYNHEIFDINIPHAYKAQRKATEIEQFQELVKKGVTFSASGIFMHTGSMLITLEALFSASRTVLDNINEKAKEKQDGAAPKLQEFKLKAEESYDVFKSGAFVIVVMYTSMLKYALIVTKSGDTMSSFNNKLDIYSRLKSIDNWEDLFKNLKTGIKETHKPTENTDIDKKNGARRRSYLSESVYL